jgi:hypothetical protein
LAAQAVQDATSERLSETDAIVHRLLLPINSMDGSSSPAGGKMVVLRVDNNAQGKCFTAGLRQAMRLAKKHADVHDAAIIPDFGNFLLKDVEAEQRRRLQPGRHCTAHDCTCSAWSPRAQVESAQCADCGHDHFKATQYEDLLHLPCIVLLNEKGRMGDSFPHSFVCMDLRLRYQDQTLRLVA